MMLDALIGREELSATELATAAGITAQTASVHLSKLLHGGLISMKQQGRSRLYRISNPHIMEALQQLAMLAPQEQRSTTHNSHTLRVCYGHMAGKIAIEISRALSDAGFIELDKERERFNLTDKGLKWLANLDIDTREYPPHTAACMDWTEKSFHLAGWLGHELLAAFVARGYVYQPSHETRFLQLTESGQRYVNGLKKQVI
ncbi:ArsR family transcriptional regulator [Neisseria sp. 83E34]|nr:ArsR family transcriptional regulator [Neisseria sp. 83E34]